MTEDNTIHNVTKIVDGGKEIKIVTYCNISSQLLIIVCTFDLASSNFFKRKGMVKARNSYTKYSNN